jgi:hypothetical protein
MSLAIAAQHLATTGRGDDTELVHMTKPEVAGLMALAKQHGGTLTRNPQTGLIEAGFLRSILPMIAGLGLAATGIGAPMAAALVGGGMGLATGSLKQGLMAGLGAYGGADLFGGLAGAGAATADAALTAAPTATPAVVPAVVPAATPAVVPAAADAAVAGGSNLVAENVATSAIRPQYMPTPETALNSGLAANAENLAVGNQAIAQQAAMPNMAGGIQTPAELAFSRMTPTQYAWQGFKNLGTKGGLDALTAQLGGTTGALKTAGMAFAPVFGQTQDMPGTSDLQNRVRPFKYTSTYNNPAGMPGNAANSFFNQQFVAQPTYVAGTIPGHAGGGLTHSYAQGGISNLGGYSDGGQLLRGPGDGVSDSIPAQIGQNQPARLAEGEFVVPARIVSELGNGSTNAGAKKLYQMLNRIQAGRAKSMRGKNAYAKNTNAARHMPA